MNNDEYTAWLQSLKVGDEVAVIGNIREAEEIRVIARLTATQIVLTGDTRFRRSDGQRVGDEYWRRRIIRPVTDKIRFEHRRRSLIALITSYTRQLDTLSLETLERVAAAFETGDEQ